MASSTQIQYPSLEHAECPYPLYDELRRDEPVVRLDNGDYLVSRHEDVHFALAHPEVFSSDVGAAAPRENTGGYLAMLNSDPPEHATKRKLAFAPFKPKRMREFEPQVLDIVTETIDAFIGDGRFEVYEQLALPIPIKVTSRLLGLPESDYEQIRGWADIEGSGQAYLPHAEREVDRAKDARMVDYVKLALKRAYEEPGDDVLSEMTRLQIERDGTYDPVVLEAEGASLLLGGIVTTAHLICSTMDLLLRSPGTLGAVQADHGRIPRLLEEVLRLESPVQWRPRVTTSEVELSGETIPAGARVLLVLGSANRDERCFHAPEQLDAERDNVKRHVAFGYGAHFCLGAPLARLEGKHCFEQLLTRAADFALDMPADDVHHIRSVLFRAPDRLPVTFRAV